MRIRNMTKRGFTLVELMIVVAIVGVLAALAIYGVRKYVLNAKTAEARNSLGQMSKDASTAYSREGMKADVLALGGKTGVVNKLCATSSKVPTSDADIKGQKYQSKPSDWDGSQEAGWTCLRFSMQDPQYYQYQYVASATTGTGATFTAQANGNLDGDGALSTFQIGGAIKADTAGNVTVVIAPNIKETDPDE